MGKFRVNFADVESSFQPLPEGTYECMVSSLEVRESRSSDNDYVNWELKVLDDEHEGRRLWMITSLGPRALWKLKDTLLALDVIEEDDDIELEWEDGVDITPQEGPNVTFPEVVGMPCVAVVRNQMYEGRERNRVEELMLSGSEAPAPAAKEKAKSNSRPTKAAPTGARRKLR
jgi:hypothetical protein